MSGPGRGPGRAVVVGGGVAGLATAALLAHDGWSVDLVERHERPGGRVGRWERDGFRFDTGPSWWLMPEVFEHFFALLGTRVDRHLDLVPLDPAYRVFAEGYPEPVDLPSGVDAAAAVFERLEPGAGAALRRYLDGAREAYELSLQRFLYTSWDDPRGLLRPALVARVPRLAGLMSTSLEAYVARRFADPRLRQVLGYPAVFLGSSPDRTPALYHLMSWLDLGVGVQYPRGGFHRLVEVVAALAEAAGARLHTGQEVVRVETEPARGRAGRPARVTGVRCRDAAGDEQVLDADVVVASVDRHHVESELLPEHLRERSAAWWTRRQAGPGAVLAMLGVEGQLPELAHHSLFFTRDWAANFAAVFGRPSRMPEPASAYVCRPSATDPTVAPAGTENLFVLVPVPADPGLGGGGVDGTGDPAVERAADVAVDQVAAWAGVPDLAGRVVVRRTVGPADFARDFSAWQGGALGGPGHTLRQSALLRPGNASRTVDGLLFAGASTIPGIGLPMCLISAELVVKRLRGDRSAAPLPAPAALP